MNKNTKIRIYCLFAASLFIGIFGAVCFYLGIAGEYNDAMGHFNVDSVFAPVVYCCLAAGPLLGIVGWVIFRRYRTPDKALPGGIYLKIASCIAAALILFETFVQISAYMSVRTPMQTVQGITVLSWIFSFFAAASLAVGAVLSKGGKVQAWVSLLSFTTVLYCAFRVLILYFDQSVAVNSPVKFICQLAYLSYMLVFTAETGLSLGRGQIFPRYIFTLCTAIAVGGTCSLAALACTVTGAECTAITGGECFSMVGLFLYCCVRFAMCVNAEAKEKEKASSEARIAEAEEEPREQELPDVDFSESEE